MSFDVATLAGARLECPVVVTHPLCSDTGFTRLGSIRSARPRRCPTRHRRPRRQRARPGVSLLPPGALHVHAPADGCIGAGGDIGAPETGHDGSVQVLSLIHISEPTRRTPISYAVFCLKKKK